MHLKHTNKLIFSRKNVHFTLFVLELFLGDGSQGLSHARQMQYPTMSYRPSLTSPALVCPLESSFVSSGVLWFLDHSPWGVSDLAGLPLKTTSRVLSLSPFSVVPVQLRKIQSYFVSPLLFFPFKVKFKTHIRPLIL
jgi:hypothetical protein